MIDELFESLHGLDSTNAGEIIKKPQHHALVTLSYLFPTIFLTAIDLINRGLCVKYVCGSRVMISVDQYIVSLRLWSCPCYEFTHQVSSVKPHEKWERVCEHLIAAHIVDHQYPIYKSSLVSQRELPLDEFIHYALYGPGSM